MKLGSEGSPDKRDVKANYTQYTHTNCFAGHGAQNLDVSPEQGLTVAQCIDRCESNSACTAVVYRPDNSWCWMRSDVEVSDCTQATGFDMYLRASQYKEEEGLNCFKGHGATEIDSSAVKNVTLDQCERRCDEDADCTAVVYRADVQYCFKRANVVLSQCQSSKLHSMYLKHQTHGQGGPVLLYAAELMSGQAPPLGNYEAAPKEIRKSDQSIMI